MSDKLNLRQAAEAYGLTIDQMRLRLEKGEIVGRRETRGKGHVWRIDPPSSVESTLDPGAEVGMLRMRSQYFQERAEYLEEDRDAWRQFAERIYGDYVARRDFSSHAHEAFIEVAAKIRTALRR